MTESMMICELCGKALVECSRETQSSICTWADATFGKASLGSSARRMEEEIGELAGAVASGRADLIANECADVLITMYRLAEVLHFDLAGAVVVKMAVNRGRTWVSHGDGTGQHVKEGKV